MGARLPFPTLPWVQQVTKSADYTLVAGDSGTLFIAGGGATRTFTLPSLATAGDGFCAYFFNPQANNLVVTAPANKLIAINNATGTTCTFSTASQIIGAFCMVWLNDAGTFYNLGVLCTNTPTIS